MSHLSMILTGLALAAMLVFIAPGVLALNRGHVLRNIALWLTIILGLCAVYQNFGPDSKNPIIPQPSIMRGMTKDEAIKLPGQQDAKPRAAPETQPEAKPAEKGI